MYDIVWIPRYRYAVLVNGVDQYLLRKLDEVRKEYPIRRSSMWSVMYSRIMCIWW